MEAAPRTQVLVVANRTAATERLLNEVRRRAQEGSCEFTLLIPDLGAGKNPDWSHETALRLMSRAAGRPVESRIGGPDPVAAVEAAVGEGNFDEIIVSTLPKKTSKWLRRDLIHRVERLGLPVTAIVPGARKLTREEKLEDMGRFNAMGG